MSKMKKIFSDMIEHEPQKAYEFLEDLYECYGEEIEEMLLKNITNKAQYDKYTSHFKNFDETRGPHWDIEVIKAKSGIDFEMKKYTCYDFAYVVNMKYSDDGDLMTQENLFKSAKRYLEDADFYGEPWTRAWWDGKMRHRYHKKHS